MSNADASAKTHTDQETEAGNDLVEMPCALLKRLLNRVDDLSDELARYRTENERDKATIRQVVHKAIEKAEAEGEGKQGSSGR